MRTPKELYPDMHKMYTYEQERCAVCGERLMSCDYVSGRKTVQTMSAVLQIAYRPKRCRNLHCAAYGQSLPAAGWQQLAPLHGTYGYDVIATIGWQRQTLHQTYAEIHQSVSQKLHISPSQVRYLYTYHYQPLLACHERTYLAEVQRVAAQMGLILTLDGLAPEGGEPQLWVVRELHTGLTLRSGWLSEQSQVAFENFLRPLAELELPIAAVLSDKQRGLVPAVRAIFPHSAHGFCQSHYLKNLAEPLAAADSAFKVRLGQQVRAQVGSLIRPEHVAQPGVLTVTGMVPSPLPAAAEPPAAPVAADPAPPATPPQPATPPTEAPDPETQERAAIVTAFKRRVRYLLTLKGRPPFRLAGLEMYVRLSEITAYLALLIAHHADPELVQLQQGLAQVLPGLRAEYTQLNQGASWLRHIADLLAPTTPPRTGAQVQQALTDYLDELTTQTHATPELQAYAQHLAHTTQNYQAGLFHTYDIPGLPRTNNDRESEFRALNQRLLRTTGQTGATRRIIQRAGAWELIPRPDSLAETTRAIATVAQREYAQERARVKGHRERFRLHTRSGKQARQQLHALKERWFQLPPG